MTRAGWRSKYGAMLGMWSTILLSLAWLAGAGAAAAEDGPETVAEQAAVKQEGDWPAGEHDDGQAAEPEVAWRLGGDEREFEESFFYLMAKLGLGLGLVVLLAWGTMQLLRKSGLGLQGGMAEGAIRIVERTYLGPKKGLFLVEVGEWTLMLGVTDERITRLAQWRTGKVELPRGRRQPVSPFAACLKKLGMQGGDLVGRGA